MLEGLAAEQKNRLVPIAIDVPFDELEKRTTGRRQCPVCGEIYNMYFKPPRHDETCDRDAGVKLVRRADDTIDKVRVRLETYQEQTKPLLDYYSNSGRLHRIEGTGEKETIYKSIEQIVRDS